MTQSKVEDQVAPASQAGLVRGTTDRVVNLYGQVKDYSPALRYGLETVEGRIPAPWVEQIGAASEPMIEGLDTKIQLAGQAVNDRVIVPVYQMGKTVSDSVISPAIATVNDRVISPAKNTYQDGIVSLTDLTGSVKLKTAAIAQDITSKTGTKVGQWKSVRGDLSKKAVQRLETGLVQVREFSATRGKEIIHFDLIEYSREVLDNASTTARPIYEPIHRNLANAVVQVNAAVNSLVQKSVQFNEIVAQKSAQFNETVAQKSTQSLEQIQAARSELQAKLQAAIQAARELSTTSVSFVQQRYQTIQTQLPEQAQNVAAKFPQPVHDSVNYILSSPQLFVDFKNKADVSASNRTIDNVRNLLAAVKQVVFSQTSAVVVAEVESVPAPVAA